MYIWISSLTSPNTVFDLITHKGWRVVKPQHKKKTAFALRFFKITGKTCGKICFYLFKKDRQRIYLMMFIRFFSDLWVLNQQASAIQMGTNNIIAFIKK